MRGDRAAGRPALPSPPLLLLLLSRVAALHPGELFPHGELLGDQLLLEGDDESSAAVQLAIPLRFYEAQFSTLYVGTNGIISTQDFPRETQYVDDDFPTDFPAIAPFLADIDTSHGRGRVLYREDTSLPVLGLAARYVRAGFPRSAARFTPTHVFLATWEQVGAYEEVTRGAEPSGELNTFQAVLASDGSDTYALFLYPADGLQFFGTRPKESYNVQLQLPARVGFCRGEADDLKREGPYFSLTSTEQSVKNLYQLSNLGIPGVWAFHIGSTSPLDNVKPATAGGELSTAHSSAPLEPSFSQAAALERDYTEDNLDYYDENEEEVEYPPSEPEEASNSHSSIHVALHPEADSEPVGGGISPPQSALASPPPYPTPSSWPLYPETEPATLDPQTKEGASLEEVEAPSLKVESPDQTGTRNQAPPEVDGESLAPSWGAPPPHPGNRSIQPHPGEAAVPSERDVPPAHPEGEVVLPNYPVLAHIPPLSRGTYVVGVEDDIGSNTQVFTYNAANKETCEHNHGQCSRHAFCTDYATGFCCHCQSSFYGNGKHCLPEGVPHRVNGKVSGHLRVGHMTTVRFTDMDLHAYVVGNDGRAYTAISHIPQPAAQALLPLTPIGGLFGWLFALEKPGSENGFSLTGATFIHDMEVTFYPGEERVHITQTAEGLDPENYLSIKTNIQGQVPYIPANFTAHVSPYKELYHYSDSDVDECTENRCHPSATCYNTPGSFSCHCQPGYHGDGFQCTPDSTSGLKPCEHQQRYARAQHAHPGARLHVPQCDEQGNFLPLQCHGSTGFCWCVDHDGHEVPGTRTPPGSTPPHCGPPPEPTQRPRTVCERWRENLLEHYGGSPRDDQYVPQCDDLGHFTPLQCHGKSDFCWCVDKDGREVQGTRSQPGTTPACIPTVAPPTVRPTPRPDVTPPAVGTFLLYAQGQQIGHLPLNGTRLQKDAAKTLLSLHGSIVIGIDYDCRERMVYWTDVAGRTISRASLEPGAEPETIVNSGLISPEGLAIDHFRRTMYWTDSGLDKIERTRLDGSERKVLFHTELVNPRAIAVDPIGGNLYWTDWNREAPKIETSSLDGENRRILINKDIGLPNGLTFDPFSKLLCWADAGTKKLECTLPDGTGRRVIQNNLNYPFSIVSYADHFYHTDWRRDGVISVNKDSGQFTDEYLPEQRSHLYGITAVYPYCPTGRK
uniref:Nidogen 2 n=1 Tax=Microcebus murinus TaxID=30608 RepID=A0A8C5VB87_MICMU